jgi:hypothetical protein
MDWHGIGTMLLQLAGAFVLGHLGAWVSAQRQHIQAKTETIKNPAMKVAAEQLEAVVGNAVSAAAPQIVNEVVRKLGPTAGPVAGQVLTTAITTATEPGQ